MKKILLTTVATLALSAGMALASPFTDQIVAGLQSQGFERIEIQEGTTQVKVEAIRGTTKLEVVYDLATGAILKQETGTVDSSDDVMPGIEYDTEDGDFVAATDDSTDDLNDDSPDDLNDDRNDDLNDDSTGDLNDDSADDLSNDSNDDLNNDSNDDLNDDNAYDSGSDGNDDDSKDDNDDGDDRGNDTSEMDGQDSLDD